MQPARRRSAVQQPGAAASTPGIPERHRNPARRAGKAPRVARRLQRSPTSRGSGRSRRSTTGPRTVGTRAAEATTARRRPSGCSRWSRAGAGSIPPLRLLFGRVDPCGGGQRVRPGTPILEGPGMSEERGIKEQIANNMIELRDSYQFHAHPKRHHVNAAAPRWTGSVRNSDRPQRANNSPVSDARLQSRSHW